MVLFSQPRPVETLNAPDHWTVQSILHTALPAMRPKFTSLLREGAQPAADTVGRRKDEQMTDLANDLAAIRQTQARYNIAGDRMKLSDLAAAFTPDGVLETSTSQLVGRAAIAGGLGGGGGPGVRKPTFVRHNLTTSLIELTGADTAEGRTYFHVYTDIGPDHMGVYVDRFARLDGAWLIAHRRVLIDSITRTAVPHRAGGPPRPAGGQGGRADRLKSWL